MKRSLTLLALLLYSASAWADEPGYGRPLDVSLDGHRSDWLFNVTTVSITRPVRDHGRRSSSGRSLMHRDSRHARPTTSTASARSHLMLTAVDLGDHLLRRRRHPARSTRTSTSHEAFWNFPTDAENPVEIEVNAQQWAWDFRYAGPDGKFNTAGRHRHAQRHARPGRTRR